MYTYFHTTITQPLSLTQVITKTTRITHNKKKHIDPLREARLKAVNRLPTIQLIYTKGRLCLTTVTQNINLAMRTQVRVPLGPNILSLVL